MILTYEELKMHVLAFADETETKRMLEEFQLFAGRGWETGILYLANALPFLPKGDIGGSSVDSYVLWKSANLIARNDTLLGSVKTKELLAKGPLGFYVHVVDNEPSGLAVKVKQISNILSATAGELGLKVQEKVLRQNEEDGTGKKLLVVSREELSAEELESVAQGSDNAYLVIVVTAKLGV